MKGIRQRLRSKYANLYAPGVRSRLLDRERPEKEPPARVSLPTGATLPKEPNVTPVFIHSASQPPKVLTGLEAARYLREEALKRGQRWPLA